MKYWFLYAKYANQGSPGPMHNGTSTQDQLASSVYSDGFNGQHGINYDLKTTTQFSPSTCDSQSATANQHLKPCSCPISVNPGDMDKPGDAQYIEKLSNTEWNCDLNSPPNYPCPNGPHVRSFLTSQLAITTLHSNSTAHSASYDEDMPEDLSMNAGAGTSTSYNSVQSKISHFPLACLTRANSKVDKYSYANVVQGEVPEKRTFHEQCLVAGSSLGDQLQVRPSSQHTVQYLPVDHVMSSNLRSYTRSLLPSDIKSPQTTSYMSSFPVNVNQQQPQACSPDDSVPISDIESLKRRIWKTKNIVNANTFRDLPEMFHPIHGENKNLFSCYICNTGFARKYTFDRHNCKGTIRKFLCTHCDKDYRSKYKLRDHILAKHDGHTVSCPDCGKKFTSKYSMVKHKKQQHYSEYKIYCKVCGKGFNHSGHYNGHMNKHTNSKPFVCLQCGKRFYGSSHLYGHKQVCQINELKYACTICNRKFKRELYLKKHMTRHERAIIANPNVAKTTDLTKVGASFKDACYQSF